jgi:hypothetical protein
LFKDGVSVASNTTSDSATAITDGNLRCMGVVQTNIGNLYNPCRCGLVYATDGTMTPGDIAAFHALLRDNLITPTGR